MLSCEEIQLGVVLPRWNKAVGMDEGQHRVMLHRKGTQGEMGLNCLLILNRVGVEAIG